VTGTPTGSAAADHVLIAPHAVGKLMTPAMLPTAGTGMWTMASPKLLILGLDGTPHALLERWLSAGELPTVARLVSVGRLLPCRSTSPPLSAPAWTSAFTGCNPGKHGIYDFQDYSYPKRRPWWVLPRQAPSIWRRLSEAGLRCCAVNVPLCYPAETINGMMVSGFGAPALNEEAFSPTSLQPDLLAAVPDYRQQPDLDPDAWPGADELIRFAAMRVDAARHLLSHSEFDVLAVFLNSLDWAGHARASTRDEYEAGLLRVARGIDEHLSALLELVDRPQTPVIAVSDHGLRWAGRQVNLPKLFTRLGLMQVRWDEAAGGASEARASMLLRGWGIIKRILPPAVTSRLRKAARASREALLSGPAVVVDRPASTAVPVGGYGAVRMLISGRDPDGAVEPQRAAEVRRGTVRALQEARDPATGDLLFSRVASRDELYHGPAIDDAPDAVLSPLSEDMAFGAATSEAELVLFIQQPGLVTPLIPPCGVHADTGILMISGEGVAAASAPRACSVTDFAPTVLHLLGLPVPSYMDGRALTECLSGDAAARPVQVVDEALPEPEAQVDVYSAEEQAELEERLRGLGYL